MLEWVAVPLLLAAFLAWFVWSSRKDKVRGDAELAAFGAQHGLRQETFTVDIFGPRTVAYGPLWPDLADFFIGGQPVKISSVWRGPWNKGEVRIFEFDRSNAERGRAILFDSPVFDLPPFVVLAHAHHRGAVGGVTPGGVPVVARDAVAVEHLFTPEVAAFFKARVLPPPPTRGFHPPDVAVDQTNDGFWQSGQTLARLMASRT